MQRIIPASMAAILGLVSGGAAGSQTPVDPKPYILVEQGDLPIVLSAPHGGEVTMAGIPERQSGANDLDENTLQLALAIQKEFTTLAGGKKAYLVAGLVSRRYVDFNRAAGRAYESEAVAPVYEAYHAALNRAVKEAKDRAGTKALLIDIHGQSADVTKVYRGTQDGQTADLALVCLSTPAGLIATMEQEGLPVHPGAASGLEPADYNGGYIVRTAGLKGRGGINAVQFEFGHDFRGDEATIAKTARAFAEALVAYLKTTQSF